MQELNQVVKQNVERINHFGTYSGDTLAKGYNPAIHQAMLGDLMAHLGNTYPIPVLEMAVKTMRSRLEECKSNIREQMFAADIESFVMDGNSFEIKTEYNAEFPVGPDNEPDKQGFYQWLIENGMGHSVKSTIDLPKIDEAEEAKRVLRDAGLNVAVNRTMHGLTIRATIKELVKLNKEVPKEVITIKPVDVLSIKTKK